VAPISCGGVIPIHLLRLVRRDHLAIAKVACYEKWFNAAGPDGAKLEMGDKECHNHFVNNPRGTVVTPEMVLAQVERYNQKDSGAVGPWGGYSYIT